MVENNQTWGIEQQETQFRALYKQFLTWQTSQQQQTDGYAYEESFAAFAQQMNHQLLTIALHQPQPTTKPDPVKKSDDLFRLTVRTG